MSESSNSATRRTGPRGVRLALAGSAVVFVGLLGAWAVMGIIAVFEAGHPLRGAFLALAALLLLLLSMRVISMNWRAVDDSAERPSAPSDGGDQTGIWGVGGPSMREPGSTGGWRVRNFDRRYENRDD
jgi:hypothetical protein